MKLLQSTLLVVLLVWLSGCAVFSNYQTDAELLRQQGIIDVENVKGYEFGHGVGATQQEAMDAALRELGQTVFVQVRSEISSMQKIAMQEEGKTPDYSNKFSVSSHIFSNVELSGHSVDARVHGRSGWYVRVKMSQEDLVKLRQELLRTAPLIAYLEVLSGQKNLQPGRKLKFAVRGLQEAQRLDVADQRITGADYGGLSYAAYFTMQIQEAIYLLLPLPYIENNQIKVALIHKETFAPVAGVWLSVGGQRVVTDKNGISAPVNIAELSNLDTRLELTDPFAEQHITANTEDKSFAILALGDQNALTNTGLRADNLLIEQINLSDITNPETTTVFVHLNPEGAEVTANGYTQTAPTFFNLPSGNSAKIVIDKTSQYQQKEFNFSTEGKRYVYITDTLIERKYGRLTLDLVRKDSNFAIHLKNQRNEDIAISNRIDEEVEIGKYSLHLSHITNPDMYQTITDADIFVRENQQLQRSYQKPLHRRPWTQGTAYLLTYGFGSKLGDNYLLPTADKTETKMQDFKQPGCSGGCLGQDFHLRHVSHVDLQAFKLLSTGSILFSGSLGFTSADFKLDSDKDVSLLGFGAAVGTGFWTSKLGTLSWISANYKTEYLHWDDTSRNIRQENMDSYVLNSYPYAEVGILFGVVAAGLRVPNPKIAAPEFFIGLGGATINSGFKHTETTKATKGLHY